jgi:hypothetical protein
VTSASVKQVGPERKVDATTERADQFDERDRLEGIPTPADDDVEGDEASSPDQGPDAFGAAEGGQPT